MTSKAIVLRRLVSQGLVPGSGPSAAAGARFSSAEAVVRGMGGVGLRLALGRGAGAATGAEIDAAFDAGRILRTHVLRPTWHFVLPEDIAWMVRLTGPRVRAGALPMQRQMGIDKSV